jgi:hypothetical protein
MSKGSYTTSVGVSTTTSVSAVVDDSFDTSAYLLPHEAKVKPTNAMDRKVTCFFIVFIFI